MQIHDVTRVCATALILGLLISPAEGQPSGGVRQNGAVAATHCAKWLTNNVIQDAGAACGTGTAPSPANPTATAGPAAVNGSATTYMRSDAAPAVQLGTNAATGLVECSTGLSVTSGVCSVSYGTTAGTAAQGNDTRFSSVTNQGAAYVWTNWGVTLNGGLINPGATTSSSHTAATYITMANSSGTLTFTFLVAGNYQIHYNTLLQQSATVTSGNEQTTLGGTSTRYINGPQDPTYYYNIGASTGFSFGFALDFLVTATANQTLTILPGWVVAGTGTTPTASANATATYVGTGN